MHRKATFSGVYTHFESFMPDTYQRGLISTLLYRAHAICSSYKSLHEEVENLKKIFAKNGYPSRFVDRCIYNFFDKIFGTRVTITTVPKKEFLLVLSHLGKNSFNVKNALTRSFHGLLPFSQLKIIFKSSSRLSSWFQFKDVIPKSFFRLLSSATLARRRDIGKTP